MNLSELSGYVLDATEEQLHKLLDITAEVNDDAITWLFIWSSGQWGTIYDRPSGSADTRGPATPERVIAYFRAAKEEGHGT